MASLPAHRGRRVAALVITLALVAVAAFAAGRLSAGLRGTPSDTSAAAGFARDMQVHHEQGVELALLVRDRSADEEIRRLAYDIATTQAQQAGQMYGWLAEWGLSQAGTEPSMTWMTRPALDGVTHHSAGVVHVPGDPMPGLATREQVAELTALTGPEAEKLFLELMIVHHQGAIDMAKAVLDRTEEDVVVELATGIIASQESEIGYMEELLAQPAYTGLG